MRLIDAEAFKERISNAIIEDEHILEVIDDTPTAYDPDKVVKQINQVGKSFCDSVKCDKNCKDCDHGCIMRGIIEIVKGGEVE